MEGNKLMEDFFNIPLVLKDYKDLIPENYNDNDYYEGKPVEGVFFQKQYRWDPWFDMNTFEILCYRIPHCEDHMCNLNSFGPIALPDPSISKEKVNEVITQFYNNYIKDNIAGIHKSEFESNLKQLSSELAETQKKINNLIEFKEKYTRE